MRTRGQDSEMFGGTPCTGNDQNWRECNNGPCPSENSLPICQCAGVVQGPIFFFVVEIEPSGPNIILVSTNPTFSHLKPNAPSCLCLSCLICCLTCLQLTVCGMSGVVGNSATQLVATAGRCAQERRLLSCTEANLAKAGTPIGQVVSPLTVQVFKQIRVKQTDQNLS